MLNFPTLGLLFAFTLYRSVQQKEQLSFNMVGNPPPSLLVTVYCLKRNSKKLGQRLLRFHKLCSNNLEFSTFIFFSNKGFSWAPLLVYESPLVPGVSLFRLRRQNAILVIYIKTDQHIFEPHHSGQETGTMSPFPHLIASLPWIYCRRPF